MLVPRSIHPGSSHSRHTKFSARFFLFTARNRVPGFSGGVQDRFQLTSLREGPLILVERSDRLDAHRQAVGGAAGGQGDRRQSGVGPRSVEDSTSGGADSQGCGVYPSFI